MTKKQVYLNVLRARGIAYILPGVIMCCVATAMIYNEHQTAGMISLVLDIGMVLSFVFYLVSEWHLVKIIDEYEKIFGREMRNKMIETYNIGNEYMNLLDD